MRLIVARCEVIYAGRVSSVLPMATRLIMWKSDGSIMVHSDAGGYKPAPSVPPFGLPCNDRRSDMWARPLQPYAPGKTRPTLP
jgi:RecB family endonuclease NucS